MKNSNRSSRFGFLTSNCPSIPVYGFSKNRWFLQGQETVMFLFCFVLVFCSVFVLFLFVCCICLFCWWYILLLSYTVYLNVDTCLTFQYPGSYGGTRMMLLLFCSKSSRVAERETRTKQLSRIVCLKIMLDSTSNVIIFIMPLLGSLVSTGIIVGQSSCVYLNQSIS